MVGQGILPPFPNTLAHAVWIPEVDASGRQLWASFRRGCGPQRFSTQQPDFCQETVNFLLIRCIPEIKEGLGT